MTIRSILPALLCAVCFATAVSPASASEFGLTLDSSEPSTGLRMKHSPAQGLIDQGMEYLGVRYRYGGSSPETGLDCSGLVQNVFRNAIGLDLPRRASDMARLGTKVGRAELKPGDLVFFNTSQRANSHVGLYIGEGQFLHAPASGGEVRVEDMNGRYWLARFNGARRLISDNEEG